MVPGLFFTALAQLDRALDYESGGWEFESLRWCQFSLCSSKVEHPADNRETLDRYHPQGPVDNIVKMSYNRFFTQEHSMKHAKP